MGIRLMYMHAYTLAINRVYDKHKTVNCCSKLVLQPFEIKVLDKNSGSMVCFLQNYTPPQTQNARELSRNGLKTTHFKHKRDSSGLTLVTL